MLFVTQSLRIGPAHHLLFDIAPHRLTLLTCVDDAAGIPGGELHPSLQGRTVLPFRPFILTTEDIWRRPEWKDASIWGIAYAGFFQPSCAVNLLADSLPSRRTSESNAAFISTQVPVKFAVPFAEATFADMDIFVLRPVGDSVCAANISIDEVAFDAFHQHMSNALPALEIVGPDNVAPEGLASLSLRATLYGEELDHPLDVELESVNGYLPLRRLRLCGQGDFRVRAQDMLSGERIKIKAGFRYLGAAAEKIIEVR